MIGNVTASRYHELVAPSLHQAEVRSDLVAAFAASFSSTAPVLRRVLPEITRERLPGELFLDTGAAVRGIS